MFRILPLLFLSFPLYVSAQLGGSPYSSFGVGTRNLNGTGQQHALAGNGVALRSRYFVNARNPAAYTAIAEPINFIFSTGFHLDVNTFSTNEESIWQRDGGLSHLGFYVRPSSKYAFTFGLEPYSTVEYDIQSPLPDDEFGNTYRARNVGSGGLNKLYWGHGVQLPFNISLGGKVGFIFGNIAREEILNSGDPLSSFTVRSDNALRGWALDLGLQYALPLGEDELTIGATYSSQVDFRNSLNTELLIIGDSLRYENDYATGEFSAPRSYSVGIGFRRPRWQMNAEAGFKGWADTDNDAAVGWLDVFSVGLSGEYSLRRKRYYSYAQGILLRGGVTYRDGNKSVNGTSFDELVVSAGLGVPMGRGRNHVNLSYSYHRTGTLDNGLILENRHSIGVTFSLRDRWFQQRKFN